VAELYLHNRQVHNIFQLLGEHENDISYSVAWALARCPSFLQEFLLEISGLAADADGVVIRLQQQETAEGITDIEIEWPGHLYLIVEAKRGWTLPGRGQLERYARRKSFRESTAGFKRLLALSECSREYAERNLEVREIGGVPVEPFSWKDVAILARKARSEGSHAEKRLLEELLTYVGGIIAMRKVDSNWVYVVSLGSGTPEGWSISWIDIVNRRSRYFHPFGSGWPKEPPNYIAFRYYGRLQSIHRIEDYEVVTNMHKKIPEIPDEEWGSFFLYTLGPGFRPDKEVRTGNIYRNGRVWCMLDTLFTCDSVSEARHVSKERAAQEP